MEFVVECIPLSIEDISDGITETLIKTTIIGNMELIECLTCFVESIIDGVLIDIRDVIVVVISDSRGKIGRVDADELNLIG